MPFWMARSKFGTIFEIKEDTYKVVSNQIQQKCTEKSPEKVKMCMMGYTLDVWPAGLKCDTKGTEQIYAATKLFPGAIEKFIT
jgi:hypothetical protein